MKLRMIRTGALLLSFAPGVAHSATTTTYTYDALGRLTNASTTGAVNNGLAMATTYDPVGNRTVYVVTGSPNAPVKVVVVPLNGLTVIPIPRD